MFCKNVWPFWILKILLGTTHLFLTVKIAMFRLDFCIDRGGAVCTWICATDWSSVYRKWSFAYFYFLTQAQAYLTYYERTMEIQICNSSVSMCTITKLKDIFLELIAGNNWGWKLWLSWRIPNHPFSWRRQVRVVYYDKESTAPPRWILLRGCHGRQTRCGPDRRITIP